MQRRFVDTLVPVADKLARGKPSNVTFKDVKDAVNALANGSKAALVPKTLDSLLAVTSEGDLIAYGDDFWLTFTVCVALFGDRARFEKVLGLYAHAVKWDTDRSWTYVADKKFSTSSTMTSWIPPSLSRMYRPGQRRWS